MWKHPGNRPDDPRNRQNETQRLARDEYERPQYGSGAIGSGQQPSGPSHFRDDGRFVPSRGPHRDERDQHGGLHPAEHRHGQPPQGSIDRLPVHELMTRRVTSVHPATSVERAARLMEECDCGALPVVSDNGVLVGMVTDRDITIRVVARGRDPRHAIVADCMSERVFACYATESVGECMHQMARHQVRRMPIVDDHGRLVGIVAQSDLSRHAGQHPVADERRALTETYYAVSQPPHVHYR